MDSKDRSRSQRAGGMLSIIVGLLLVAFAAPPAAAQPDPSCVGTLNMAPCDDGNACTADSCNPSSGCQHAAVANGTTCNDGNACTQSDTCQSGTCVGSNPISCTASDQCHVAGTCDPTTGQCSNPTAADGTTCGGPPTGACDAQDTCLSGVCQQNVVAAGIVCRGAAGACDAAETCNGVSPICPADSKVTAGT